MSYDQIDRCKGVFNTRKQVYAMIRDLVLINIKRTHRDRKEVKIIKRYTVFLLAGTTRNTACTAQYRDKNSIHK